jgi:CheY-like chemotaxis protein
MSHELISMTERLIADLRKIRSEEGGPAAAEPFHVLIIEDRPEFAKILETLSKAVGCQTRIAGTAWLAEQSLNEPTDIVFLDLNLPDSKGAEVFHIVRRLQPGAHIIVVTAYPALLDDLPAGEYFGVVLKPATEETLRDIVEKYRRPE